MRGDREIEGEIVKQKGFRTWRCGKFSAYQYCKKWEREGIQKVWLDKHHIKNVTCFSQPSQQNQEQRWGNISRNTTGLDEMGRRQGDDKGVPSDSWDSVGWDNRTLCCAVYQDKRIILKVVQRLSGLPRLCLLLGITGPGCSPNVSGRQGRHPARPKAQRIKGITLQF